MAAGGDTGVGMSDPDPGPGCLFFWGWPRASLRQWLLFILGFILFCIALYHLFSWLGWEAATGPGRAPVPDAPSRVIADLPSVESALPVLPA
jgi:hypothetical protein